jgi:hypothetical protein
MKKVKPIVIENAKIAFLNFSGKEGKYNPKGIRNFCIILEENLGKDMEAAGWNIRWLDSRDESEPPVPYVPVRVNFENIPPRIYLISSRGRNLLTEDSVNILDWAEIENVDLKINAYAWELNGRTGIKAYLSKMYVTIIEDEFEKKYNMLPDSPDSAKNNIGGCGSCDVCDGSCGEEEKE